MLRYDALIVGGGPAGSTCAASLHRAGWNVLVIDRARFPRDKVCAGWITPAVFRLLELEPLECRAAGLTLQDITGFRTGVIGGRPLDIRYRQIVSYAIRRCEFDLFLLRRASADVRDGTEAGSIRRVGDRWIVNDTWEAPVLVGAGGHFCPVARTLRDAWPGREPVIAQEVEFRLTETEVSVSPNTPELFFCRDLDGYGWCIRKGEYLNLGIGRRHASGFASHRREFQSFLLRAGKTTERVPARWLGHAYYATGAGIRPLTSDGLMLVGDAAGLAYPESGEGIRPAIESGSRRPGR